MRKNIFIFVMIFMLTMVNTQEKRPILVTPSLGGIYAFDLDDKLGAGISTIGSFPLSKHFNMSGTLGMFFFNPKNFDQSMFVCSLGFEYILSDKLHFGLDLGFYPGISVTINLKHRLALNVARFSEIALMYGYSIPIKTDL